MLECYAMSFCGICLHVCNVLTFLSYGAEKISSRVCSFQLIYIFFMLQMPARRKTRGSIHLIEVFNEVDEQGHSTACTYNLWDWVLLRPSSRGHFWVKKKDARNVKNQWKGRIKAFRYLPSSSSCMEVLIQHVYMHKELALSKNQMLGHMPNNKLLSLCIESFSYKWAT